MGNISNTDRARGLSIVFFVFLLSACGGPVGECLDALDDKYSHLSFDKTSTKHIKLTGSSIEGPAKLRKKGDGRNYFVKDVSCDYIKEKISNAKCLGCPKRGE